MFTHGKVVCMNLRLVREVNFEAVVTPEMEDAHWKDISGLMQGILPADWPEWNHNYYWVPKKYHHLIRKTRKATLAAVRKEARPLFARVDAITKELSKYDSTKWMRLRGVKQHTTNNWRTHGALYRERSKIYRQLRVLDRIAARTEQKPTWSDVPAEALRNANPDLALYQQEKAIWPA